MTTAYFDRNVFDRIDKLRDITEADVELVRREMAEGRLSILVSLEVVAETLLAPRDIALKGLRLIEALARQEFPIKPHYELLRDDIRSFANGEELSPPFVGARFSIRRMIGEVENPSEGLLEDITEEKRTKERRNRDLVADIEEERKTFDKKRLNSFDKYRGARAAFYAEGFANAAGCLDKCRERGIDALFKVRSVAVAVGAFLSLRYSLLVENRRVQSGTSYDMQHAAPMSAADVVVSDDGELRRLLGRVLVPGLRVLSLPEFVGLIRSGGLRS
jgi:hypothetical protein